MKGSLLIFLSNAAGKMHFELSPPRCVWTAESGFLSPLKKTSPAELNKKKPDRFYMQRKNASKTAFKNSMHFLIHNFYNSGLNLNRNY